MKKGSYEKGLERPTAAYAGCWGNILLHPQQIMGARVMDLRCLLTSTMPENKHATVSCQLNPAMLQVWVGRGMDIRPITKQNPFAAVVFLTSGYHRSIKF